MALLPLFLLFLINGWPSASCHAASTFGFDMHHRFSDTVRRWAESGSWASDWPAKGSIQYYATLAEHDRVLRGRGLASNQLSFSDGNASIRISSLGFLHYAQVSLGTPNVSFLVALDTGSDLFWVPCDCQSCAPTSSQSYGFNFEFSTYSPNSSTTSKQVPCSSKLCEFQPGCSGTSSSCPYKVAYVSANTSSSGILVEDVMYLRAEDPLSDIVEAHITFGCGQVQTGSFLDTAAPNGLFGLGMENISVPSILANAGLTSNSFSMCFGPDGIGRINFGDKGSSDQDETPFSLHHLHPTYNISMTGIIVGNISFDEEFSAIVDSGTSFTYLADPAYTFISETFNSQVQDKRQPSSSKIPFEYCYSISSNKSVIQIPDISLRTNGGSQFPVMDPLIIISGQTEVMYCLAIVKSPNVNIIGQNFMTGLRIVFDREKLVLGWKKFNCYNAENSNVLPVNPRNASAPSPSIAALGPSSYTPEATKGNGNTTQVSLFPPQSSHSLHLYSSSPFLMLFLLLIAIL